MKSPILFVLIIFMLGLSVLFALQDKFWVHEKSMLTERTLAATKDFKPKPIKAAAPATVERLLLPLKRERGSIQMRTRTGLRDKEIKAQIIAESAVTALINQIPEFESRLIEKWVKTFSERSREYDSLSKKNMKHKQIENALKVLELIHDKLPLPINSKPTIMQLADLALQIGIAELPVLSRALEAAIIRDLPYSPERLQLQRQHRIMHEALMKILEKQP